jgi:hypothetical protein
MSIFGPRKVSKLGAWLDARRAHRAQRELPAYLDDRLAIARRKGPREGEPPFLLAIHSDGGVGREPNPKYIAPNPLAAPSDADLRLRRGSLAADELLHRGYKAQETVSQCVIGLAGLEQEFSVIESQKRDFIKANRVPHRLLGEWLAALLALSLLALGELAALALVVADWLGVDLARTEVLLSHPVESGAVLLASAGIFVASVLLASKIIEASDPLHRIMASVGLLSIGAGLGVMRASQIADSGWQQTFIFVLVTVAIPLGVAVLKRRAAAAYTLLGEWRKLQRQKQLVQRRKAALDRKRRHASRVLARVIAEFVDEYMQARAREARALSTWLRWLETMEASLAEYRLAYLWWAAHRGTPKVGTAAVLKVASSVVLPLLLVTQSCARQEQVHVALLCDRSSSGAEVSCPARTVLDAGRYWADAAESRGGTFEIWLFGRGIEPIQFASEEYPRRFKPPVSETKRVWRRDFEARLGARAAQLPTGGGSAIAEGVWRVARRLNEVPGRKVLVVASDLRQVTPGVWNFERHVPRADLFLKWIGAQGLTVQHSSAIELVVCGVHSQSPAGTSPAKADRYNRTRALWERVFAVWQLHGGVTEQCFAGVGAAT